MVELAAEDRDVHRQMLPPVERLRCFDLVGTMFWRRRSRGRRSR
jgi:hypothetical protein